MTLYTLDSKKWKRIYLVLTLICFVASAVYEYFSHGVLSIFMIIPGFVVFICGYVIFPFISDVLTRLSFNLFNSTIATLVIGCYVKGVLDIYGTGNDLVNIYFLVAGLFAIHTIAFIIGGIINERKRISKS